MKNIKFRYWDGEKMHTPTGLESHQEMMTLSGGHMYKDGVLLNNILMQFTGIKDKNGNEIYEGDIVSEYNGLYQVYWDNFDSSFRLRDNKNRKNHGMHDYGIGFSVTYLIKGNIFEHEILSLKKIIKQDKCCDCDGEEYHKMEAGCLLKKKEENKKWRNP